MKSPGNRSSAGLLSEARVALTAFALLCAFLAAAGSAFAETATVNAPAEVIVGGTIEITWTGPDGERDFISVDEEGDPDRSYGQYIYTSKGQPGVLKAPDMPGTYVIRYHSGDSGYAVLGSTTIRVEDTAATLSPVDPVAAGETLRVEWKGPGRARDFISIDEPGSPDRSYGPYAYAKESPVEIRTPDEPGSYIVRYHLAQSYRVIGEAPLTVGGVTASLTAAAQVQAGADLTVSWVGPDNRRDYLSIDPAGSGDREYGNYAYTSRGNPATIRVPEEPGSYVVRYHMANSRKVLASSDLEVLANNATVTGPASVAAGSEFEVEWTGPDNHGDFLTIVPAGAGHREYMSYGYTKDGSPAKLEAPLDPGAHELRYMTGAKRQILATATIQVTPGAIPGELRVLSSGSTATVGSVGAVEVILDASGSMLQRLGAERRIEIAKRALTGLVQRVVPEGTPFALRVFGHKEADSCRSDLEIPAAPLERSVAVQRIQGIQAMNLAKTPIAASLLAVKQDLSAAHGPATVVLVTDGEETCEGDPKAAIEELKSSGFEVRVNIVGFAIDEQLLKEQFEEWARTGGGRYVEANDGEELEAAMGVSLEVPFSVQRGTEVVATGVVGGEAIRLLPGTYRVRLLGPGGADLGEVEVEPEGEHVLRAP